MKKITTNYNTYYLYKGYKIDFFEKEYLIALNYKEKSILKKRDFNKWDCSLNALGICNTQNEVKKVINYLIKHRNKTI